ncbi:hypothetical protein [Labrys wisconsinensis]|uniref:Uncharacterized protein n=1 Tax=Labrys wisconsinensis TaxID=425677 RepID=A0ABU0J174_9HYPH|nr:hypothetical protein [Labrys wisconsinensis]MDQ0468011.1 hypothetical protein [Labrys wisconsinensis]
MTEQQQQRWAVFGPLDELLLAGEFPDEAAVWRAYLGRSNSDEEVEHAKALGLRAAAIIVREVDPKPER